MQIFPPIQFSPIIAIPTAICLAHQPPTIHLVSIIIANLIFISGIFRRNYCNMAASLLLLFFCEVHSLQLLWNQVQNDSCSEISEMFLRVISDGKIWALTFENILLVIFLIKGYQRYKVFRNQIMGIETELYD